MKFLPSIKRIFAGIALGEDDLRYGLQLATAVVIAYLIPWALDLPEGFWAVMSALIVMRSRAGSTMGEGWGRFKGTLAGTLGGLFGVWLHTRGMQPAAATLATIAGMAFIAGIFPVLRSAPITALIVLSSGAIAGQSVWLVAGLRIVEIVIGIGAGMAVMLLTPGSRSAAHFERDMLALLMDIGEQTRQALCGSVASADDKEEAARQMRLRLRRLSLLGASADTEHGFSVEQKNGAPKYRRCAHLVSCIAQDAALFGRLCESAPELQGDPLWRQVARAVPQALAAVGLPREDQGNALTALLDCVAADADAPAARLHRLLEAPVRLLAGDIQSLLRLRQA